MLGAACVVLAAASVAVAAQAPASGPARPGVGPERAFQLAPRVERTLPNGLRVIVMRQAVIPKVTATLTVLSGYSSDPPNLTGLAAFTGDAVQGGTTTRTSRQISTEAFGMGGSLSAISSQDYSSLQVRGLAEFAPKLIDLLADVAMHPSFPEDEFAIVKQQHLQNVAREKASPQSASSREFRRALFGPHPYARTASTVEMVQAIDRATVAAFHDQHYRPNNAFLLIVGAVDAEPVLAAVEKAFGGWTRRDVAPVVYAAPTATSGRHLYFVQRPNSIQSSISVGHLALKRSDPRWYETAVANTIFGGAFNSRLVRNLREEKGYTYSPASILTGFVDAGFYRFAADVRNEVTGATLTEVFKEFDRMRAEPGDQAELGGAKQYMRGLFAVQTATQNGLSAVLNNVYVFGLPKDYPETYRAAIAGVTPAQVKTGASTLLRSDASVIVVVGDYGKVKDQLAGFGEITFLDLDGKPTAPPQ